MNIIKILQRKSPTPKEKMMENLNLLKLHELTYINGRKIQLWFSKILLQCSLFLISDTNRGTDYIPKCIECLLNDKLASHEPVIVNTNIYSPFVCTNC